MKIQLQRLIFGQIGSILFGEAVYPVKTVSEEWDPAVHIELLDPKDSVKGFGDGMYSDPVFAKLPSEQELQFNATTVNPPVAILLPDNVRIEVGADCPARLMTALLQALKNYA